MGLSKKASGNFDWSNPKPNTAPVLGEPNPQNFTILRWLKIGYFFIVEARFPDCQNYEGRKIMVYDDLESIEQLQEQGIDPHFMQKKGYHSPIARFVPTLQGWAMAEIVIEALTEE